MKKRLQISLLILVIAAGVAHAEEESISPHMMEMMKKMGGAKPDERTELNIPAPMKVMQKRMMRKHLDTISEITAALAANELEQAAKVARERLGWSPAEEKRCSMVEKMTGEAGFTSFGMAVHKKADELADAAQKGDRDKAMGLLSELINNCNNCHKTFRH
ncbi:MAG: cytochrome c [Proteobacteria bacterium]|nr:cytochrome c [Pseudomonadota bacterium]